MPETTNVQPGVLGEPEATVASGIGTDLFGPADVSDSVQKGERVSPCALELFAGSCKLSKCLKSHGFAAFGIDHQKCKNRVGPCVVMDLTKKSSRAFISTMLHTGRVAAVPMAPPCGTSSRARERPLPARLKRLGVPEPKPLRSAQHPLGFPWLRGTDRVRVNLANECYTTVAIVFTICVELMIAVFIENPANSRMWDVPCIRKLFDLPGVYFTKFHACMHGGTRDKLTALLHTCPQLCRLEVRCDKQHQHQPWTVSRSIQGGWKFDTSSEAEYPMLMCSRMASAFAEFAISQGWVVHPEPNKVSAAKLIPSQWKVAAGRQPRGRKSRSILPEDGQVVTIEVQDSRDMQAVASWRGRSNEEKILVSRVFPKASRLISFREADNGGECGASDVFPQESDVFPQESDAFPEEPPHKRFKSCIPKVASVKIGVPMTPSDAIRRAREAIHPFDEATQVSDAVGWAMELSVTRGVEYVQCMRVKALRRIKARAAELEAKEQALRELMQPEVAQIYEGKRFLLFQELMEEILHPDKSLVNDLIQGMRITGNAMPTGVFPPDFKPAQLEEVDLWRVAKFSQGEVQQSVPRHVSRGEVEVAGEMVDVAKAVWSATLDESAKGWLDGPLSAEEVTAKLGPLWTPSRRFGIVQGGKIRNIDDLSEFAINQTYGTPEKLDLGGVDEVVALAAAWVRKLKETPDRSLLGRCLDLKGAYKQIALARKDRANAVLAVFNPELGAVQFFVSNVLPFGATGAVMGFNRVSRALRDIMQRVLMIPVVNYFDDFPHVDRSSAAMGTQAVMEEFMEVLGWHIAKDPNKRLPPCGRFTVLGVIVDLEHADSGVVKVHNKPERARELEEVLQEVEEGCSFPPALAAKIQGRMMFAEAQCCGRWLLPVLEPVRVRAAMPASVRWPDHKIVHCLRLCVKLLREAPSRSLNALSSEEPCLVFTDGAYEDGVASCGVVLISSRCDRVQVMSFEVPAKLVAVWKKDGLEQVIAQAELLPVMLVKKQFRWALEGARVLYFIDNEGAKEALISGSTKSVASRDMLVQCMIEDSKNDSLPWYARVPSPSNIADGPSRLCTEEVEALFPITIVQPELDYMEWGKIG